MKAFGFDPILFCRHNARMDDLPPVPEPESASDDVARAPGEASDPAEFVARYVPADVLAHYEVFSYRNAALILSEAHVHPIRINRLGNMVVQ